jgi:two-component system LytT family response regulator
MRIVKAIAIDDNESALKVIEAKCADIEFVELVKTFSGPIEAGKFLKANTNIELIFLDINMPDMSGLEFLETYKPKQSIIFISKHKDKAFDSFEVKSKFKIDVVDFLEMPVRTARFVEACNSVHEKLSRKSNYTIQKDNKKKYKINYDQIILIESDDIDAHFCNFYLTQDISENEKNPLSIRNSLSDLEKDLPSDIFLRVSRNSIINIDKIKLIDGDEIITSLSKKKVNIGDKWKEKIDTILNLKRNK